MASIPPISGIMRAHAHGGVDPQSGDSERQWKQRLLHIFSAYARSRPGIISFRLIGVADKGREIVRTNHDRDGIHQVPESLLQHKEHRPYYQATLGMKQGEVFVSDLNLKREHGHIETPHTPVLRVATPVFDARGHLFGMAVLDESMLPLFARMGGLETGQDDEGMDYLVNGAGEILHGGPQPAHAFSFEFGRHYRVQDILPDLADKLETLPAQSRMQLADGHSLHAFVCHLDAAHPERRLILLETHARAIWGAQRLLWRGLLLFGAIAVFGGLLAAWTARRMTKPLTRLAGVAKAIAHQEPYDARQLPLDAEGELGDLAHAFQNMMIRVSGRERELTDAAKQLQAHIGERDSNLQAVLDTAFGAAMRIDEHGGIVSCNHVTERIFGYKPAEMIGHNICMLMPEPDCAAHDGYLQAYQQTGVKHIIGSTREARGQRKDGSVFPIKLSVNEMQLADGSRNFIGIVLDVSVQKEAESDARLFRSLIEHFHDSAFVIDAADGRVLDVNAAAARRLGYSVPEMLQLTVSDFFVMPPDLTWVAHAEEIRQHGSLTFEVVHRTSDGSEIPMEISAANASFDGREYILAIAHDIRERKQTEERIRQLSRAMEQNPCSILITDRQGNIEYVNRSFARITGYTAEEVIGNNPRMLQSGETSGRAYKQLWDTITNGEVWHGEIKNRRKNGEIYWDESSIAPIMNEAGDITHFVGVQEDISARKQMEFELSQARDAAQAAVQTKSIFLATMSHEIRTPLNTVLGMGELLQESPLNDAQREYVESLNRTGNHLFMLINDILDFSRLEAGHLELDYVPFDPLIVARDALEMQRPNAKKKGIELIFHADDLPDVVKGDAIRLTQVLVNLVGNAVKFTGKGSVTLEVMRQPDSECTLTFCVRDTGCGIPQHMQQAVFNEFTQVGKGSPGPLLLASRFSEWELDFYTE